MNATVENIIPATLPKSDQLNAEQLLPGPMTVTITDVTVKPGEQPVTVHYEGEEGRPYKPCKTMLRVLCLAWTENGNNWRGKSMTLYNDPTVKWGGAEVGGIRISHMSDIPDDIRVSLTKTRGNKAPHIIKRLATVSTEDIDNAPTVQALKDNFGAAYKANKAPHLRARLKAAYDKRLAELQAKPAGKTLAQFQEDIEQAPSREDAEQVLAEARAALPAAEADQLATELEQAWT